MSPSAHHDVQEAHEVPPAPPELLEGGRRLWQSVTAAYVLEQHEEAMLVQACRTVDTIDALDAVVAVEGITSTTSQGLRAHPAVVEGRQQRIALARILAALRLPTGTDEDARADARPQRRSGTRGVYAVK